MTKQEQVARIAKYYTTFHLFGDWYYCDLHNLEILNYLAWEFEMPGYVKTVREEDDYPDNWITIIFKKR